MTKLTNDDDVAEFITDVDEFITIVSGLPRSGTSMVMRMLEAGGMPVVVDGVREADADNPRGYYEDERVKHLRSDHRWLEDAYGKAVKVVAHSLYDLPSEHTYRIIFLDRKLDEVVASQRQMLKRRGKEGSTADDIVLVERLKISLQRLDDWFQERLYLPVLYLRYGDIVADPLNSARDIEHFLETPLCIPAMADVVDPQLYRIRMDDTA